MTLIERLHDLHKQATTEHSHYYVAKVCKQSIDALEHAQEEIYRRDCDLEGANERIAELEAENTKLRKIAAHVPARIYITAKEAAGHGVKIVTIAAGDGFTSETITSK